MDILPKDVYSLEEYLKKNPDVQKSELQIIRDWINKQPHLPKLNDVQLILFLHSNYYQLEPTKITIENFLTFKTHVTEFFGNRDPFLKEIRSHHSVIRTIPAKKLTKEGYQIIYTDIMDPDPSNYVFSIASKYFFMVSELANYKEGPVDGLVVVTNANNMSLGHIGRFNLMGLKKFLYYVQEAAPIRLKKIYILNCNPAIDILMNMIKPFMKKELYEMLDFTTLKRLETLIPIDLLPNELGGKAGNFQDLVDEQIKILDDNREYFLMDEAKNQVNESLRIGKPKSANDLFGVEGSFKKLEID
ncbi:hypothetical protein M0802_011511 [Mischocyttarus mexicanus]|nr:hypothetical protein M0802_011511 [Mischocyttarus mexicanus]